MARLKNIQCHACKKSFDYSSDIPSTHRFSVYCAFCEAENVIELAPYLRTEEKVFRADNKTQMIATGVYDFPESLQGQQPNKS